MISGKKVRRGAFSGLLCRVFVVELANAARCVSQQRPRS